MLYAVTTLLILYAPIEISFLCSKRILLLQNVIYYHMIMNWAKKNIPDTWSYEINFISITSDKFYIKCVKKDSYEWTNDFMSHKWGRAKGGRIFDNMRFYDNNIDNEIRKMKRDSKIEYLLN